MNERNERANSMIKDSLFGIYLLKLLKGYTGRREVLGGVVDGIAHFSGIVNLPGFREAAIPVHLATNGQEVRFLIGDEPNPIVRIETGAFDENGRRLEFDENGYAANRAHLVAVTNSKKGWQPWDTEALLYDKTLTAVKGYVRKELGELGVKAELFYND